MGRMIVWLAVFLVSLPVVWLAAGRHLALFGDRFFTVRERQLPAGPLEYDGGGFLIGGESMTFGLLSNLELRKRLT